LNNFLLNSTIIIRITYNSRPKLELLKDINFIIFGDLVVNQIPKVHILLQLFTATAFTYPKITKTAHPFLEFTRTALLAHLRLGQVATENALVLLNSLDYQYKLKYPSITRRVVYQYYIDYLAFQGLLASTPSTPSLFPLRLLSLPLQWSQLKSIGTLLALLMSYLIHGQISVMQRRQLRSGYSTVGNPGALLLTITRLDFSYTVSFQPAPFISELHRTTTCLESLHMLHTTALLRLIRGLNHETRHGILQALLNAMSILIDTLSQRRLESELGYIINYRIYRICQRGELGSSFETQLMGMRVQALA
jgi:hypothetical protein